MTLKTKALHRLVAMLVAGGALGVGATPAQATTETWTDVGSNFASWRPAVTKTRYSSGLITVNVYAIDQTTGGIRHLYMNNFGTREWGPDVGGIVTANPSAVSWQNHQEVFVRGTDKHLWRATSTDGTTQYTWEQMGGPELCSDVSAVSFAPGFINVFAKGCSNGHLVQARTTGGAWSWSDLPILTAATPAACSSANNIIDVLMTTPQTGTFANYHFNGSSWSSRFSNTIAGPQGCAPIMGTTTNVVGLGLGFDSLGTQIHTTSIVPLSGNVNVQVFYNGPAGPDAPSGGSSSTHAYFYVRQFTKGLGFWVTDAPGFQLFPSGITVGADYQFLSNPATVVPNPAVEATKVFAVRDDRHLLMLDHAGVDIF